MAKLLSREDLYQLNTIATKKELSFRDYRVGINRNGEYLYSTRKIRRTKYLKICWNCGATYESYKYNSYACDDRCSGNILYKLKKEVNPPANMTFLTKAKRIKPIIDEYGYG